jgi:hypothetical protein
MRKAALLAATALCALGVPAYADTIDPLDPLHSTVCSGAGTGCATTDNNSFAPLTQLTNWGFQISPGPATGDTLTLAILVPLNQILALGQTQTSFSLPAVTDAHSGLTIVQSTQLGLFNAGDGTSLSGFLGLNNGFSPTDNFSNASAGEATENPGFAANPNFVAFTVTLTGSIALEAADATTLLNDFSFGANVPDGTVIAGFFHETTDKQGNPCISKCYIGTAASNDLVVGTTSVPVPGPTVGAGLPGLGAAGFALLGLNRLRRRRTSVA